MQPEINISNMYFAQINAKLIIRYRYEPSSRSTHELNVFPLSYFVDAFDRVSRD